MFVVAASLARGGNRPWGALFALIVIFLPGGLMEGVKRIRNLFKRPSSGQGPGKQDKAVLQTVTSS